MLVVRKKNKIIMFFSVFIIKYIVRKKMQDHKCIVWPNKKIKVKIFCVIRKNPNGDYTHNKDIHIDNIEILQCLSYY